MAAKYNNTPLDEIQFRRPEVIQYWGGFRADTVHPIIRESPFFDHSSKNGLLWDQAASDPHLWELCNNRLAFEERLRGISGVEYMIVKEPERTADGDSGIWVIHKQDRRKSPGAADQVTLLATYYIMGENMYQAPSVYDVVGNRLLSAMNSMNKFAELAKPLPLFTPALGYTYYPPAPSKPSAAIAALQASATQSSRESSVAPAMSQSNPAAALEGATQAPTGTASAAQAPDPRESFALFESFQMMQKYGDEYMDENPLRGEPGNFTFSATKERIRAKQAEAEAAKAREAEIARKLEESRAAAAATPFARNTTAEKAKADGASVDAKPKKVKTGGKKRKSRTVTGATSPMTPATPATPAS